MTGIDHLSTDKHSPKTTEELLKKIEEIARGNEKDGENTPKDALAANYLLDLQSKLKKTKQLLLLEEAQYKAIKKILAENKQLKQLPEIHKWFSRSFAVTGPISTEFYITACQTQPIPLKDAFISLEENHYAAEYDFRFTGKKVSYFINNSRKEIESSRLLNLYNNKVKTNEQGEAKSYLIDLFDLQDLQLQQVFKQVIAGSTKDAKTLTGNWNFKLDNKAKCTITLNAEQNQLFISNNTKTPVELKPKKFIEDFKAAYRKKRPLYGALTEWIGRGTLNQLKKLTSDADKINYLQEHVKNDPSSTTAKALKSLFDTPEYGAGTAVAFKHKKKKENQVHTASVESLTANKPKQEASTASPLPTTKESEKEKPPISAPAPTDEQHNHNEKIDPSDYAYYEAKLAIDINQEHEAAFNELQRSQIEQLSKITSQFQDDLNKIKEAEVAREKAEIEAKAKIAAEKAKAEAEAEAEAQAKAEEEEKRQANLLIERQKIDTQDISIRFHKHVTTPLSNLFKEGGALSKQLEDHFYAGLLYNTEIENKTLLSGIQCTFQAPSEEDFLNMIDQKATKLATIKGFISDTVDKSKKEQILNQFKAEYTDLITLKNKFEALLNTPALNPNQPVTHDSYLHINIKLDRLSNFIENIRENRESTKDFKNILTSFSVELNNLRSNWEKNGIARYKKTLEARKKLGFSSSSSSSASSTPNKISELTSPNSSFASISTISARGRSDSVSSDYSPLTKHARQGGFPPETPNTPRKESHSDNSNENTDEDIDETKRREAEDSRQSPDNLNSP